MSNNEDPMNILNSYFKESSITFPKMKRSYSFKSPNIFDKIKTKGKNSSYILNHLNKSKIKAIILNNDSIIFNRHYREDVSSEFYGSFLKEISEIMEGSDSKMKENNNIQEKTIILNTHINLFGNYNPLSNKKYKTNIFDKSNEDYKNLYCTLKLEYDCLKEEYNKLNEKYNKLLNKPKANDKRKEKLIKKMNRVSKIMSEKKEPKKEMSEYEKNEIIQKEIKRKIEIGASKSVINQMREEFKLNKEDYKDEIILDSLKNNSYDLNKSWNFLLDLKNV